MQLVTRFKASSVALVWLLAGAAGAGACASGPERDVDPACEAETPTALFERRIEPVLNDDRPQSCNQCHLSGIDLSMFVRETPCETMACLTQRGLVDLNDPQSSEILTWIERAEPESELITEEVIRAEYDAFLEWIEYQALCGEANCAGVSCGPPNADPFCDVANEPRDPMPQELDPGGCDDIALEQLFLDTVYTSRQRCFPCHFSSEAMAPENAPRFFAQEGSCEAASLASMRIIIAAGYIDVEAPEESPFLLKPLAEDAGGTEHEGHSKFADTEDPTYQSYLYWITRYAECQSQL